ncbi:MAG: helix-turn-helix domain-containing protein [Phycisphaerales bacterium JB050]
MANSHTREAGALSCANENPASLLLSQDQAAALLGVHRNTIANLRRRGELPATRIGRRVFWRRDVLAEYIDRQTETSGQ